MSRDSVSRNSNKNNKIDKINSKNLTYYLLLSNNTVMLLDLIGYHLLGYLLGHVMDSVSKDNCKVLVSYSVSHKQKNKQ